MVPKLGKERGTTVAGTICMAEIAGGSGVTTNCREQWVISHAFKVDVCNAHTSLKDRSGKAWRCIPPY